jgi:two-component system LytT family response regulator/two-component system response regulator LytT
VKSSTLRGASSCALSATALRYTPKKNSKVRKDIRMAERSSATATLNVVIVDDEQLARDELAFLLKSFPQVHVAASADNGLDAVELIEKHSPDLVFLDVQMPGLDGLGVVRRLMESGGDLPHFIFATAYDQYAVEAFEVNAVDYLLKPIEKERLALSIERIQKRQEAPAQNASRMEQLLARLQSSVGPRTKLLVNAQNRMFLVDAADVIYATIQDGLITIVSSYVEGQSNYRTIEELQSNLDPSSFWRVHRSYLVNINRIKEVVPWFKSSYQLRMSDKKQTEIPVSRAQTKRLRELFKL